jgi:N-methylhydantoinase A/oxoprolinase/acetone carboxylase beta subunit
MPGIDVLQVFLVVISALSAWFLGTALERKFSRKQAVHLAQKLTTAENEAQAYRKSLAQVRQEAEALQKTLAGERAAQSESLLTLARGYQKKMIRLACVCVGGGFLTGGVLAGWGVGMHSELQSVKRFMDLEVRARVAEARSQGLELQLAGVREDYKQLWRNFVENLEAKTVTTAKMEALLDQLTSRKLKGSLELDVEALRRNLEDLQSRDALMYWDGAAVSIPRA